MGCVLSYTCQKSMKPLFVKNFTNEMIQQMAIFVNGPKGIRSIQTFGVAVEQLAA
jgi:hypothetical protein